MLPPDINAIMYDILETCAVPDFQLFLKTLSANVSLNGVILSSTAILDKAEEHYRFLILSKRWDAVRHRGSSFQGQGQHNPSTSARCQRTPIIPPSWHRTAPSDGERHDEERVYKWCATAGFTGTVDILPTSTFKATAPRRAVDHATPRQRHLELPQPRPRQIWHRKSIPRHQQTQTKIPTRKKARHLPTLHAPAETTTSTVASEVLDAPCFLTSGNYGQSPASTCLSIRSRFGYFSLPFVNSSRHHLLEPSFVGLSSNGSSSNFHRHHPSSFTVLSTSSFSSPIKTIRTSFPQMHLRFLASCTLITSQARHLLSKVGPQRL